MFEMSVQELLMLAMREVLKAFIMKPTDCQDTSGGYIWLDWYGQLSLFLLASSLSLLAQLLFGISPGMPSFSWSRILRKHLSLQNMSHYMF